MACFSDRHSEVSTWNSSSNVIRSCTVHWVLVMDRNAWDGEDESAGGGASWLDSCVEVALGKTMEALVADVGKERLIIEFP